ncbi:MAG: NUDIX hydrolase [Bryobacterales bacterium]|nr:NUDIX hydrolase [Bryobacterales bacterium]MBV9398004.1 NUDIX hydrolase [Bryobacterales bacterium]
MKLISSKELVRTPIFHVTFDHAVDPDGFEIKRAIVQHGGSAVMMAVDDHKRILLVRQYRLPARRYLWELPAGRVDEGETTLQAARRELMEETGYRARSWKKLAEFYPSPGFLAEKMTIFLATELTEGTQSPMEDERIETRWFSARELDQLIGSGKMIDAKTQIGFLKWKRYVANK